jgi:hypothetical protein
MSISTFSFPSTIVLLLLGSALMLQGCGGDGSSMGEDTSLIGADRPRDYICTAEYRPVCGKALPNGALNCAQAPCPTHEYRTFSNACHAFNEEAQFSFQDECEGLEGQFVFDDKPVRIKELAEVPVDNAPVTITSAVIEGGIVTLEVSYAGGCQPHEFNLFVSNLFMESDPVQTESLLSHVTEDTCEALVTETLTFDLLPLREFYQRIYGQGPGSINIQGIGTYTFTSTLLD